MADNDKDPGFAFAWWNLSPRRRFFRELWVAPVLLGVMYLWLPEGRRLVGLAALAVLEAGQLAWSWWRWKRPDDVPPGSVGLGGAASTAAVPVEATYETPAEAQERAQRSRWMWIGASMAMGSLIAFNVSGSQLAADPVDRALLQGTQVGVLLVAIPGLVILLLNALRLLRARFRPTSTVLGVVFALLSGCAVVTAHVTLARALARMSDVAALAPGFRPPAGWVAAPIKIPNARAFSTPDHLRAVSMLGFRNEQNAGRDAASCASRAASIANGSARAMQVELVGAPEEIRLPGAACAFQQLGRAGGEGRVTVGQIDCDGVDISFFMWDGAGTDEDADLVARISCPGAR